MGKTTFALNMATQPANLVAAKKKAAKKPLKKPAKKPAKKTKARRA